MYCSVWLSRDASFFSPTIKILFIVVKYVMQPEGIFAGFIPLHKGFLKFEDTQTLAFLKLIHIFNRRHTKKLFKASVEV